MQTIEKELFCLKSEYTLINNWQKFRVDLFLWIEKYDKFCGDKFSQIYKKNPSNHKINPREN